VLFRDQIGADATQTLPFLIHELVPTGLRGLMAAALLAALMSTIAAALNSSGTLVAVDIARRLKPGLSDGQEVRVGRVSAVVVMLLAMAWSTQGHRFDTIFEAINKMPAQFLAPPITTVFLWGVFWRRGTREAALTTLALGFSLGIMVFLVDLPVIGDTQLVTEGLGVSFMMQAWWGFCICSAIFVVVSLLTPAPPPEQVEPVTWASPWQVIAHGRVQGLSDPRVMAGMLLLLMVVLYAVFR
jgi:SSS family solute:Na+ symporter